MALVSSMASSFLMSWASVCRGQTSYIRQVIGPASEAQINKACLVSDTGRAFDVMQSRWDGCGA